MTKKLRRTELDVHSVERMNDETPYEGYGKLRRHIIRHRRYDGSWSPMLTRELFESGDAVVVLPYDPEHDAVVLIEQFRISAYARGIKPWLIECIAGRINHGERPEDVAIREAKEEANCQLSDLIKIGEMFISPGIFAEYVTIFCARTDSQNLDGIHGLDSEQEDIRVLVTPFDDAMAALQDGRINTSPPFICLNWLAKNKDEIRQRWLAGS